MSEYAKSLPEDPMNLESISQYLNSENDYENGAKFERLLVMPQEFDLDPDLPFFSPPLQFFQLYSKSLNKANQISKAFCERIHKNQLQANDESIQKYRRLNSVRVFEVRVFIIVAILELDWASTDDE